MLGDLGKMVGRFEQGQTQILELLQQIADTLTRLEARQEASFHEWIAPRVQVQERQAE